MGVNGTATINYGQEKYPKYGAGLTLNYRNKKFNVYANYNYAYRYWFNHLMLDRKFLDTVATGDGKQLFRYYQDNYALFNFVRFGLDDRRPARLLKMATAWRSMRAELPAQNDARSGGPGGRSSAV